MRYNGEVNHCNPLRRLIVAALIHTPVGGTASAEWLISERGGAPDLRTMTASQAQQETFFQQRFFSAARACEGVA